MQIPHISAAVSLATRSPSLNPWTRFPACATTPENSCPRITGTRGLCPSLSRHMCTSLPHTETERIFFPNCRHPYVPQLNGPVLVVVMNHGRHFLTHPSSLLYAADYLTQHCNDIPIGSMESVGVDDQGRPQNHQRGPTLG